MRRPDVPPDLHQQLVVWAQWCRGRHLPAEFNVLCQSAERNYLPEAGNVWQTATEALQASLQAHQRVAAGQDMLHVELAELRLPERPRMALRLHYVVHKRMPVEQTIAPVRLKDVLNIVDGDQITLTVVQEKEA